MPSLVELQYNPYIPRLSILLNGKQPSDLSQLIQYSDEDIWQWCNEIFDALYSEIRDDFVISFTGYKSDMEILDICRKPNPHCLGIKHQEFIISEPVQKRLGQMNQAIKTSGVSSYHKTGINASFYLSDEMSRFKNDVQGIDISNLFCAVNVSIRKDINSSGNANEYIFALFENKDSVDKVLAKYSSSNTLMFMIYVGKSKKLTDVKKNIFVFETDELGIIETVFDCLLRIPLLIALRDCVKSIPPSSTVFQKARVVAAVNPIVNVDFPLPIEVGKSVRIVTTLDPPVGQIPKLEYRVQNESIATCDGMNVYGKSAGETKLEAYLVGEKNPFEIKSITVIKRNRITKLMLSETDLTLGVNDKKVINCDYAPYDADNVSEIKWKSTNPSVVKVDSNGRLLAVGSGEAKIICTAENVSEQCICSVKPYLSDFVIETELEENLLRMLPLEEKALKIKSIPNNAIDGKIIVKSSNTNIVNVVGQKLFAKTKGEATITVSNANKRISKSFIVIVGKPKRGFFQKIFRKSN